MMTGMCVSLAGCLLCFVGAMGVFALDGGPLEMAFLVACLSGMFMSVGGLALTIRGARQESQP